VDNHHSLLKQGIRGWGGDPERNRAGPEYRNPSGALPEPMFSTIADVRTPFRLRDGMRMPTYRSHRNRYRVRNRYRLQRSPSCLDSDADSDPDAGHLWGRILSTRWRVYRNNFHWNGTCFWQLL